MRAWRTIGAGRPSDVLSLQEDVRPPDPYPGSVLVDVLAAGIGLPDALMCEGTYALTPDLPFTQGQEVVGRVIASGDGAADRNPGDRVMAVTSFFTSHGGFAERCLVLDNFCLPVPDGMPDADAAAFLIPFHTAYIGLVTRGKLEHGETLLVLGGAGGTGSAAIQIGKALGARVIATAAGAERAGYCESLGADVVIDRKRQNVPEEVLAATEGKGASCIYDPVGGDAFADATKCIAHEGRILAIGFASGSWARIDTAHLVFENYSVVGVVPSKYDRAFREAAQAELVGWWREGRLQPYVDEVVPFENLPEALGRVAAGEIRGKLVLGVSSNATVPGRR